MLHNSCTECVNFIIPYFYSDYIVNSDWVLLKYNLAIQRDYAYVNLYFDITKRILCSVLTGRKHDLTACKFGKNGVTGRIYDW